ncbi:MAG: hypothetical protein AAGA54_12685, partial [Myxococcota bacterium]
ETETNAEADGDTETDGPSAAGGGGGCQLGSHGPNAAWLLLLAAWVRRRPGRHTMQRWPSA